MRLDSELFHLLTFLLLMPFIMAQSKDHFIVVAGITKVKFSHADMSPSPTFSTFTFDQDVADEPIVVDYDPVEDKIYWNDFCDAIGRVNRDGSGAEIIRENGISNSGILSPMSLDVVNRKIYLEMGNEVAKVNMDGTEDGDEVVIPSQPAQILKVVNENNHLYIVNRPSIKRANLDGTELTTLLEDNDDINSFELDIPGNKMYWTVDNSLRVADLLGGGKKELYVLPYPGIANWALELYYDYLYVAADDHDAVLRIPKDGNGNPEIAFYANHDGLKPQLTGIFILSGKIGCVSDITASRTSPTEISVTWPESEECMADTYQVSAKEFDIEQCSTSESETISLPWQELNTASISDLDANKCYQVTVSPETDNPVDGQPLPEGAGVPVEYTEVCIANLQVYPDKSFIFASWTAPLSTCKEGADEYQVTYQAIDIGHCDTSPGDPVILPWQSTNEVTLNDLHPYSTYDITVTPRRNSDDGNVGTIGKALSASPVETLQQVPITPPGDVDVTHATEVSLAFSWSDIPCENRGAIITGFVYKLSSNSRIISGETASTSVTIPVDFCGIDCCIDEEFHFEVAAENSVGVGPYSEPILPRVLAYIVPFESELSVVVAPRLIEVSWLFGKCFPRQYRVEYRIINRDQCNAPSTDGLVSRAISGPPLVLSNLVPYSTYSISVTGIVSDDESISKDTEFVTASEAPSEAPVSVALSASEKSTSLAFSWGEVPCGGRHGEINQYLYELRILSTSNRINGFTDARSVVITDLTPNTEYEFSVAGVTSAGTGPYSDAIQATTAMDSIGQAIGVFTKVLSLEVAIYEIDGVQPLCVPEYMNQDSVLARRFQTQAHGALRGNLDGYRDIRVNRIRCGSVIIEFDVEVDETSTATNSDLWRAFLTAGGPDGNIGGGLSVALSDTPVPAACPESLCSSSDVCTTDISNGINICRCSSGSGRYCEGDDIPTDNNNNVDYRSIIAAFCLIGAVIAILAVAVTALYIRRSLNKSTFDASVYQQPAQQNARSVSFVEYEGGIAAFVNPNMY